MTKTAKLKEAGIAVEVLPLQKIHAMSYVVMRCFSNRIILATKKVKVVQVYPVKQFQGIYVIINAEYSIMSLF